MTGSTLPISLVVVIFVKVTVHLGWTAAVVIPETTCAAQVLS